MIAYMWLGLKSNRDSYEIMELTENEGELVWEKGSRRYSRGAFIEYCY